MNAATWLAAIVFWTWVPFEVWSMRNLCRCHRQNLPWFYSRHVRVVSMAVDAVVGATFFVIWSTTWRSPLGTLFTAWVGIFAARDAVAAVVHERGKIKRAARALGRVVVKDGRLAVVNSH